MTGCEIIGKKGSKFYLFKVRHDGMDVEDILKSCVDWNSPKKTFERFFDQWGDAEYELEETKKGMVYEFEYENWNDKTRPDLEDSFSKALEYAEGGIGKMLVKKFGSDSSEKTFGEFGGYLCGYSDYEIFIDFDKKTITNTRAEEYNEDDEDGEDIED